MYSVVSNTQIRRRSVLRIGRGGGGGVREGRGKDNVIIVKKLSLFPLPKPVFSGEFNSTVKCAWSTVLAY